MSRNAKQKPAVNIEEYIISNLPPLKPEATSDTGPFRGNDAKIGRVIEDGNLISNLIKCIKTDGEIYDRKISEPHIFSEKLLFANYIFDQSSEFNKKALADLKIIFALLAFRETRT
jgi:hypothetical protein